MKYYKALGDKTAISKAIVSMLKGVDNIRSSIQNILINAEEHYLQHGDYTLINDLLVGVDSKKGMNAAGLIKHVETFVKLTRIPTVDKHGRKVSPKGFTGHSGLHTSLTAEEKLSLIEKAKESMWYDTKPQKSAFEDFNPNKILAAALKQFKDGQKKVEAAMPEDTIDKAAWKAAHMVAISEKLVQDFLAEIELVDLIFEEVASNDDDVTEITVIAGTEAA